MLTGLLPGLREIRAPLISGYLWLVLLYLLLHDELPKTGHPGAALKPLFEIGAHLSTVGLATVAGVTAYLLGSAMQELLKLTAGWIPTQRPLYGEPGTHMSRESRREVVRAVDKRLQIVRQKLVQVALVPGEGGVEREPYFEEVEHELPLIRTLLLGDRPELIGELDRLQAEVDLRITVAVPLAALSVFLAFDDPSPGWLFALLPAALLLAQGYKRQKDVGDLLARALKIGKANAPSLESLEASVDAALERVELEEELSKKKDQDGNAMVAYRLGYLQASSEDFEGAVSSFQFASHNGVVRAYAALGRVYERLEDDDAAERAYREGESRRERRATELLAALLHRQDRREEALKASRQAEAGDEAPAEPQRDDLATRWQIAKYRRDVRKDKPKAAYNLGLILLERGDVEGAIKAFEKECEQWPDDFLAWSALGVAHHRRGEFEDALGAFRRALTLREDQFEPDHPSIASALTDTGAVLIRLGRYEEARDVFLRARGIAESQLSADHPEIARALGGLANALSGLGQFEDALGLHEQALPVLESALGSGDSGLANTLNDIALLLLELDRPEEALALATRARSVIEAASEPDMQEMANAFARRAGALRLLDRLDEAEEAASQALKIADESAEPFPADSWSACLREAAEVQLARDRPSAARPLAERAVDVLRQGFDGDHPELAAALDLSARATDAASEPSAIE